MRAWKVEKILLPLDGSPRSKTAICPALDIAEKRKAMVIALNVIPVKHTTSVLEGEIEEKIGEERTIPALQDFEKDAKEREVDYKLVVEKGDPAEKIVEVAHRERASLIVMATQGPKGVKKLLGSVATKVLTKSRVPVLCVTSPQVC